MGKQPAATAETGQNDLKISKAQEWYTVGLVTLVILPATAVAVVGGYGFAVWISQMFFGPPGHGG